ncbi:hypothetical protein DJFAAGMI_01480 [Comamonas sp. PE63]|uniref:Uncharacterized protein n=1 Tax=Comamonas brasiliensis TaxID=1812482 RepID=A0ABS5LQH2_9BURK|nr:hypothetical protein [Comamonas sp. PE63]
MQRSQASLQAIRVPAASGFIFCILYTASGRGHRYTYARSSRFLNTFLLMTRR